MTHWLPLLVIDDIVMIIILIFYLSIKQRIFIVLAGVLSLFTIIVNIMAIRGYNNYFFLLSPFVLTLVVSLVFRSFLKRPLGVKSAPFFLIIVITSFLILLSIAFFAFLFIPW